MVSLNAILACKEQDWPQALLWLATFDAWALEPDAVSFSAAMSALERRGLWSKALQLLEDSSHRRLGHERMHI